MDIRELRRALRRKLEAEEDRGRDHIFLFILIAGSYHRAAKFSHSMRGQLPPFVVGDTARRLKLNREELSLLVDCPLDREEFYRLWKERDP